MRPLTEQVRSYAAYHRDWRNKLSHVVGVPLIVYALFIPLGWFRFAPLAVPYLSGATLFFLGVLTYYWRLDRRVALVQTPLSLALLWLADRAALAPFGESVTIFALTFIGGWIIQAIGHVFEGRRPALVDNIWQVFNAPLFLTVELLVHLGLRKDLAAALRAESSDLLH